VNVRAFTVLCGILSAGSLYAQKTYPTGTVYFRAKDYAGPPVADAPYCGETRNVRTITQADGTQKTEEYAPSKSCRDSAGRSRVESPVWLQPGGPQVGPLEILLRDPVARAKYVVYPVNKTVYRQQLPPVKAVHPPRPMPFPAEPAVLASEEKLGTQVMEGLVVEGRRYTLPPGSSGNWDTRVTRIAESWWSPELGVSVLEKTSDAVKGELVHTLIHITRGEPDPEMLRLPPDYAVVDEGGDFTIPWGSESGAIPVETAGH